MDGIMWRQAAAVLCGTLLMATSVIARAAGTPEKPNIVFIFTDDQRWDALGLASNNAVKTPNLDRMAKEGQYYPEAVIQVPTCSASRAAILTGVPPAINGWYSNQRERKDVVSPHGFDQYNLLPKELTKVGYKTALSGKWHIKPDPWLCGFEDIRHWMEAGAGAYKNARITFGSKRNSKKNPEFTQTIFTNDAIDLLKEQASPETTRPLFLWLAYTAPHAPFTPNPEPFSGMYKKEKPTDLAPDTFYGDADKTAHGKQTWQNYYEAITAVDAEIGRVMDTIRESGLSSNTLVVMMSDNGFLMGSRGGLRGKYLPYDEALKVPMIVWGPESIVGIKGTTVTASVNSLDLTPTFLKIAGGTPPEDWAGRDLSPVFKDGKNHDITWTVSTYPDNSHSIDYMPLDAYHVIRTPEYKVIHYHPDAKRAPEMFDLKKDPAEKTNIYGRPEVAKVQADLEQKLAGYEKKTGQTSYELKGPIVDHITLLPDGTFAKDRKEAAKIRKKLGLEKEEE